MDLFKTKYRIVERYKDDILDDIHVDYKKPFTFFWHRLRFNYCMADIDFRSGNLCFIKTYDNPYKYGTSEWWEQERKEIKRLLDKWYVNPHTPTIRENIIEI